MRKQLAKLKLRDIPPTEGHSTKQLAHTYKYVLHISSWDGSHRFLNLNRSEPDFVA